jgi:hypothetical protein
MAYREVSKHEIKKRLNVRNLDIVLIYFIFAGFYLLAVVETVLSAFVFYLTLVVALYTHTIALMYLQNKRSFLLDLMDYDLNDIWTPMLIWGLGMFFIFGLFYKATGASISWASIDEAFYQIILVVPSETLIFAVYLPEIMPATFGTIPLIKLKNKRTGKWESIKIPGWFWGAGFFFGTFHFWSFGAVVSWAMLFKMLIAMFMGLVFYGLYRYGKENKQIGGIMSAMALHFVINYWALSTANIYLFGLSIGSISILLLLVVLAIFIILKLRKK